MFGCIEKLTLILFNSRIIIISGIGSDGRSIESVGNGASDGTHNSSIQQNSNNEHTGHNNTGGHNSLAQSGASSHEGNFFRTS